MSLRYFYSHYKLLKLSLKLTHTMHCCLVCEIVLCLYSQVSLYIWATTGQNMSSGVSDQARLKPVCAATEASYNNEISAIESRDIILSKQRKTKVLIRLRGCAGWSAPLLFAYDIRHFFSWPDLYAKITPLDISGIIFWSSMSYALPWDMLFGCLNRFLTKWIQTLEFLRYLTRKIEIKR